jgi:hypothetical protein
VTGIIQRGLIRTFEVKPLSVNFSSKVSVETDSTVETADGVVLSVESVMTVTRQPVSIKAAKQARPIDFFVWVSSYDRTYKNYNKERGGPTKKGAGNDIFLLPGLSCIMIFKVI